MGETMKSTIGQVFHILFVHKALSSNHFALLFRGQLLTPRLVVEGEDDQRGPGQEDSCQAVQVAQYYQGCQG